MLWLIPEEGTKLQMMSLLYWQLANGKSVEREFKAVVDTLIRDQAEFTECRLMLGLIPKEGTKLEGEQETSGRRAGEEQKASRRRA